LRALLSGLCLSLSLSLALAVAAQAQGQAQDASSTLTRLHEELHLTSNQETAWRQYQTAMAGGAQAQARRQATERMLPQLQTPRRLALLDAAMSQDLADFHSYSQAVLAFYDRLTPDQQRTFDRESLPQTN
jgi:hypothetical protein